MWIKIKALLIIGALLAGAGLVCYMQPVFFMGTMVLATGCAMVSWLIRKDDARKKKG